ncbi:RsfA family transcriptional regulator [Peribacillus sp. JNUCC 23]|uniref:RsfA family transcriptional regulator n=1 Tax=Peribacillus sp. NPDC096379 TaxID=3364393 RepID=UPI00382F9E87
MKVRQDAWTEEDDLLLAETVLRHVREGSTQLNAFEEVGDKLNRTSAACGFRWNAVVRHTYDKALQLAKKQRKQRNRMLGKEQGGKKRLLYTPPAPTADAIGLSAKPVKTIAPEISVELSEELAAPMQTREIAKSSSSLTLDMVISFLQSMDDSTLHAELLRAENERLKLEMKELRQRNNALENQMNSLEQNSGLMQEDYETLMNIMNRARKLVLLEEDERPATKFKMDRNGNLEKVAE